MHYRQSVFYIKLLIFNWKSQRKEQKEAIWSLYRGWAPISHISYRCMVLIKVTKINSFAYSTIVY